MTDRRRAGNSGNPYANPELANWMAGFEGLHDWPLTNELPGEKEARTRWQNFLYRSFDSLGLMLPGLALALGVALLGKALAAWAGDSLGGVDQVPVSAVLVMVVLGLLIRNIVGLPSSYEKGLGLCVRRLLRLGIVLLGLRLSLGALGQIGLLSLPVVVCCIATALVAVSWFNRVLDLPRRLGSLIAVGTSICGVSAVMATSAAIDADEDEVGYAVACVTIFGMLGLFAYPFLSFWIFDGDPLMAGLFLGTAVHDTAQVAGAGLLYAERYAAPLALDAATATKLVRNTFMVAVIPLIAMFYQRSGQHGRVREKWYRMVPLFVLGFLAMVLLRSLGDFGSQSLSLFDRQGWDHLVGRADAAARWCLALAMAGVGLGTSLTRLRGLGFKPISVGLAAALIVGAVSVVLVKLVAPGA